ncbi:MAG: hypothetical protein CME70_13430 [Halobacteriovorax sp.]|nr:hypothetical protein [Halobacteriovorax sp.]|tara:strand:- start:38342 stop:39865 length:1524 start_codon:yes stop_codon:yes gene_type:complete
MKNALLALVLLFFSLSSYALEETFFFQGKKEIYKVDGFETTADELQEQINTKVLGYSSNRIVKVRVEEHSNLDFSDNIELAPEVTEDGEFTIIMRVTSEGLKNAVGIIEAASILKAIHNRSVLNAPLELFEILYNAEEDHAISKDVLNKINLHALNNPVQLSTEFMELSTFEKVKEKLLTTRMTALKKRISKWSKKVSELKKAQRVAEKKRKNYLKAQGFDKKSSYQIDTAIKANDRDGAVELLDTYLPWEQYSPFETKMYGIMLGAMAEPVAAKYRVLMFRGIGDDRVYTGDNGEAFQLPPVLVKNQGTFNRRLRSLQTMHNKYISQNRSTSKTDNTQASRISTMLHNHMIQPKGSPFRSLTPDIRVARSFGPKKILSFVFDPRVIIPNFMSTYKNELEFLVPFATFPDEHAGTIEKADYASNNEGNEANLLEQLVEKFKTKMSSTKAKQAAKRVEDKMIFSYAKGQKLDGLEFTKKARVFFANYLIYSKDEMLDDKFFFNNVFSK